MLNVSSTADLSDNKKSGAILNRLAIAFFFDEFGIVDEYFFVLLEEIRKFTSRNVFVSNGPISEAATERLVGMGFEIVIRDNVGFDVWAYKAAIEYVGYENLGGFDEVLLFNHTFYGPIFPFEEMFGKMDQTDCGFWGITAHKELDPNPFTNVGVLPRHLNSHFIAARRELAASDEFREYWQTMPMITSYNDSVLTHESRFSKHFEDLGHKCVVYDDDHLYSSKYPCFINVDEALENRCPILKRRIFFHDPIMHESHAIDLPRALRIMRETSSYDESLIWTNIIRTADLRTLNTVAGLTSVLPDARAKVLIRKAIAKIAVCIHVFYVDMIDELLELTKTIAAPFDLILTTDTAEKAQEIEQATAKFTRADKIIIRSMKVNRGRDMSSLFITCRDIFLGDTYDLVCRLHSKKSPQVDSARSNIFKRHLFENLLGTEGYVDNVIDMFEEKPWVGLAVPPAIHISYSTLGMGWFANKPGAAEKVKELGLRVKLDENTPVAAYGTMFWFRPKALHKLFERQWDWEEFNSEPYHIDGGLSHILERLIAYTAQDAGYATQQISSQKQMSYNYSMLEFKYAELSANVTCPFHHQVWMMKQWAAAGNALPGLQSDKPLRDGFGFKSVWYDDPSIMDPNNYEPANALFMRFHNRQKAWQHVLASEDALEMVSRRNASFDEDFKIVCDYMRAAGISNGIGATNENLESRVREYLLFGWAAGVDIFALFDTAYYLNKYDDVARSHFNPFVHYITYGAKEGRQPHPLFDPQYYASRRTGETAYEDPVLSFLSAEFGDKVSGHPLFDMELYQSWYPDVKIHGENALSHYIRHGARERRRPHILFDQNHYEAGVGGAVPSDVNPLVHYLEIGAKAGIDPHPLFDIAYYNSTVSGGLGGQDALSHFLSAPYENLGSPHPLFDMGYYARQYGVERLPLNALEHYLKTPPVKAQSAHPFFDGEAYLRTYPEVQKAGMDPLIHYVKYGALENRAVPGFDDSDYIRQLATKPTKDKFVPFVHFLKYGQVAK